MDTPSAPPSPPPTVQDAIAIGLMLAESMAIAGADMARDPTSRQTTGDMLADLWPTVDDAAIEPLIDIAHGVAAARWRELGRLPAGTIPCAVMHEAFVWPGDIVRHLVEPWRWRVTRTDGVSMDILAYDGDHDRGEPRDGTSMTLNAERASQFVRCLPL